MMRLPSFFCKALLALLPAFASAAGSVCSAKVIVDDGEPLWDLSAIDVDDKVMLMIICVMASD
jgi:hypothetical protein